MTTSTPPTVYEIPPDARQQRCKSPRCQAVIVWIDTPKGKKMPVTVATGYSHFVDCLDADRFRNRAS